MTDFSTVPENFITLSDGTKLGLDEPKAFGISDAWLRAGWDTKVCLWLQLARTASDSAS